MTTGASYLDPIYDQYEQAAAHRAGIDPALLRAIRTQGERSNANQVSSAGAQTVYQIIPSTRAGLIRNYGIDPYSSPEDAATGAALLVKEGLQRNHGDVAAAIGEYHGGIDRRNWGPVNAAYRARVTGAGGIPDDDADINALYGIAPAASAMAQGPKIEKITTAPGAISKGMAMQQTQPQDAAPAPAAQTPDYSAWIDNYIRSIVNNA